MGRIRIVKDGTIIYEGTDRRMANNNGWTKYLVGVLVAITLFTALPTMAGYIVSNDKESRARDEKIDEKVDVTVKEQLLVNQEILIELREIKTDLKYLKSK